MKSFHRIGLTLGAVCALAMGSVFGREVAINATLTPNETSHGSDTLAPDAAIAFKNAVVKKGSEGVLVATAGGAWTVPPLPVEVVCGLGAGDAFGGALVHGLLSGWPPERMIAYANAAGAIVASRLLCADAMPTAAEIELCVTAGVPDDVCGDTDGATGSP